MYRGRDGVVCFKQIQAHCWHDDDFQILSKLLCLGEIDHFKVLNFGIVYLQSLLIHDQACPRSEACIRFKFVSVLDRWQLVLIHRFHELVCLDSEVLRLNIVDKRKLDHFDTFLCIDRAPVLQLTLLLLGRLHDDRVSQAFDLIALCG